MFLFIISGMVSLFSNKNDKINKSVVLCELKQKIVVCINTEHGEYDRGTQSAEGILEESCSYFLIGRNRLFK